MSESDKHWTEDYEHLDTYVERVMSACRSRLAVEKAMLKLVHRRPDHKIGQAEAIVSPTGDAVLDLIKSKGEDLTAEIIEAASSMLVRDLQTMITPVDAEASTRRGCKHLQTFSDAVKDANGITGLRQRFFADGATCVAGFLYVYADPTTKELKIGRLLPTQTFWDEEQCPSGEEPLDLFYVDSVPTMRLETEFPAKAKQIRDAGKFTRPRIPGVDPARVGVSDNRMVILAWCRKQGPNHKGHYVMKVGKGGPILEQRRTDYEHHPVAHFPFGLAYTGWGGKSLAQTVAREDLENQDLNASVVRTVRAMVPVIWKKVGTVWESTLTQDEWQVQEYDGPEPPKAEVPKIDISVVLERIAQNRIRAFARAGINPEMAQGRRPGPGLNSEPSIDAAVETSTIRLADIQARWGEADRELTRAIIMVGAETYGKGEHEAVIRAPGTGMIEKIKWAQDIGDVSENKYNIQVKLASGLSLTWAGRLRDMENLKKVAPNSITETIALKTLKLNDIETETSRLTAYTNEAERQIDVCLNQESPVPTPYAYPELLRELVKIGKQELMRAKNGDTNYPEDNVEKLRKLIDKAGKMLADLEPPMPAAAPEAPAPVPGPPGAPPGQAQGPGPTAPPTPPPVA